MEFLVSEHVVQQIKIWLTDRYPESNGVPMLFIKTPEGMMMVGPFDKLPTGDGSIWFVDLWLTERPEIPGCRWGPIGPEARAAAVKFIGGNLEN